MLLVSPHNLNIGAVVYHSRRICGIGVTVMRGAQPIWDYGLSEIEQFVSIKAYERVMLYLTVRNKA